MYFFLKSTSFSHIAIDYRNDDKSMKHVSIYNRIVSIETFILH